MVVRNNFVARAPMDGIGAAWTRDCSILHNTIHDPRSPRQRLIRLIHDNDGLIVANNQLHGLPIRNDAGGRVVTTSNVQLDSVEGLFVDPDRGDLRLRRDHGIPLLVRPAWAVERDIDGRPRPSPPTAGAHEPGP